jgi:RHS repeat-associated protein
VTSSAVTQNVNPLYDSGTVSLVVYNASNTALITLSTNYGQGSTPSSVAEGLAGANSNVNVAAVNDILYIEASGSGSNTGSGTNSWSYAVTEQSSLGTSPPLGFANPSFQGSPNTGNLTGGDTGATSQTTVYSYSVGYDSAGNLTSVTDSVMGSWTYSYDTLNRLQAGRNTATTTTSQQYAGQYLCWAYDAFGNRTAQQMQSSACPSSESSVQATASYNANNQVTWTTVNAAVNGFGYDASGDVINDNTHQYLYDAEGRICAEASTPVAGFITMTGYVYDAGGNRIAKGTIASWSCDPTQNGLTTAGNETDYILGPGGEQVTELAQDANGSMNWQRTYVYAGALIATYDPAPDSPSQPLPSFRFTDWLGTMRATTDAWGVAQGACAGLPYGDGQACSGNIPDPRYFTGKERDAESGNDYFGARYYASVMGRWLSPDWSAKEEPVPYARTNEPQTLNLYAYVGNNPTGGVDPDGHKDGDKGVGNWIKSALRRASKALSPPVVHAQEAEPDTTDPYGREMINGAPVEPLEWVRPGEYIEPEPFNAYAENPGPLSREIGMSFMGGRYLRLVVGKEGFEADNVLYRSFGGNAKETGRNGTFYTLRPVSPLQNIMDNAVSPQWKNSGENTVCVSLRPGTVIYIGLSAPQSIDPVTREPLPGWNFGGTTQIFVPSVTSQNTSNVVSSAPVR